MNKTFLILGGYGNTGKIIAELLLKETNLNLILAGRNLAKAENLASKLNHQFNSDRVSGMRVDAADSESLKKAFERVDFVIVASSTSSYVKNVAEAAINAKIDYLDIQFSSAKVQVLQSLKDKITEAGCCFITECGFHPGLIAVLVRYAIPYFDKLEKANVGSLIKIDWQAISVTDSSIFEIIEELKNFNTSYFKDGVWQKVDWSETKRFNFGLEFGEQTCFPMFLEEMRSLPEIIPSLQEIGFYVGGFNWFVDYIVFSIALLLLKFWPQKAIHPMGKFMSWGLKTFSKPPYRTILLLEASGWKDERYKTIHLQMEHEDGYIFTAVPVIACLLQYLDDSIKKTGLWLQANIVEPNRMLQDIQRLGISIELKENI